MMSILKLLYHNPYLAADPALPHFIDEKRYFSTMVKGGWNAFARLLGLLLKFFDSQKDAITWPEPFKRTTPLTTVPVVFPSSRSFVCPSISDYSCEQRILCPLSCLEPPKKHIKPMTVGVPANDLRAFNSQPLSVIGLDEYVCSRTRSDRGLFRISPELPFDLQHHPRATSHTGQIFLARLAEDAVHFAKVRNSLNTHRVCSIDQPSARACLFH